MVQKFDIKELVKRLKAEAGLNKENITFRVDPSLSNQFKETCKQQNLKIGRVVEELMRLFVDSVK
jgi:hypothetical protein